jgi:NHL repeat
MRASSSIGSRRRDSALGRCAARMAATGVVVLVVSLLSAGSALGHVSHEYLPALSAKITEGPAGLGFPRPGPVSSVEAIVAEGGHLWLGESLEKAEGASRVDEFDIAGEAYLGQLVEEGGANSFTGVGVGHIGVEEQVYVAAGAEGTSVVAVFGPSRTLQAVWRGGHTANGSFTQNAGKEDVATISGVAADERGLETAGDVYVATRTTRKSASQAFNVVDVLKGQAKGGEGEAVGQITGTCAAAGVCSGGEVVPFREPTGVAVSASNGDVLVADGNREECERGEGVCVVDVFEPVAAMPGVYSFLFKIPGPPGEPFKGLGALAVDPNNGEIYVAEKVSSVVDQFSKTGAFIGRLAGTPTGRSGALSPFKGEVRVAVDGASGEVFVAGYDRERLTGSVDAFGPDVVTPDVEVLEPPSPLRPHTAVLRGRVSPLGEGEAQCEFEYGTSSSYGQRAACEPSGVPEGNANVEVHSREVPALSPDTVYHYRLDASNHNGLNTGECPLDCGEFTTPGPGVTGTSAAEVTASSATLAGSVNPNGKPTSYYFQYATGSTEGCGEDPGACLESPAPPGIALGSVDEPLEVEQHIQRLAPATVYHYRLVAVSELQPGISEAFAGPDQTFTTQPVEAGFALADGRMWEIVSPPDKHGALLLPIQESGVLQASVSGDVVSYRATRPTEAAAQGYSEYVQILSRRGEAGWGSQDISLPHSAAVGLATGNGNEYRLFSEDLSRAVVDPLGPFSSLAPCLSTPDSERTPYLRDNTVSCAGALGSYRPLLTTEDVPPGTKFGGAPTQLVGEAHVLDASGDLAHVVVSSPTALAAPPEAGETTQEGLYEWSAASPAQAPLQLVSILPDGKLAPGSAELGSSNIVTRGAVSSDGSRVVWSEKGGHLFVRDLARGKTLQVDAPQPGCVAAKACGEGAVAPGFQLAAREGSRVFFTDTQRLTADAGEIPGKADLYVCDVVEEAGGLACRLHDLTGVAGGSGAGADVQGTVIGASEDGSWVYFVANGALVEGAGKGACHLNTPPPDARCNLYLVHEGAGGWGAPRLVAVLGGEDWPDWGGAAGGGLDGLTARVSGNGRFVAFMSDRSLTGYDNRDAVTRAPDEEVFLYDSEGDGGAGSVVCASCDPTGARPAGVDYAKLKEGLAGDREARFALSQGIAASVPGWTAFKRGQARHQSRYLSDAGRLFFDSSDGLVAQDVNHNLDVYEFEPAGVGSCSSVAAGFSSVTGGCVGLVSSGAAAGESGFIDASESGDDVFFLTGERLVRGDIDGALDLYDAHACSAAPCFSEAEQPPACTTAEACRPGVSAPPGVFGAPASATFSGPGNLLVQAPAKPVVLTTAQKLAAALRACHKDRGRHKRRVCERRAHKRYPIKKKAGKGSRG